jgi:hypothetical protein
MQHTARYSTNMHSRIAMNSKKNSNSRSAMHDTEEVLDSKVCMLCIDVKLRELNRSLKCALTAVVASLLRYNSLSWCVDTAHH